MVGRFIEGRKYTGETIFGGCGQMDYQIVTVLKRTKGYIISKDRFGVVVKSRRMYSTRYEYFTTYLDSFYAYLPEPD